MAEFCTCGSIIIGGSCTNKNCVNRATTKTTTTKSASSKTSSAAKKESKPPKTRRSSKVITYNLYDTKKPEENI